MSSKQPSAEDDAVVRVEDCPASVFGEGREDSAVTACRLCCSGGEGVLPSVDLMLTSQGNTCHYFCLLFRDIDREVKRGARLKCVYCRKKGATVGCAEPRCKKSYHLNCGHRHQSLQQYFDQFRSYCREHRPVQKVARRAVRGLEHECGLCGERVVRKPGLATIVSPCCSCFLHRSCVQTAALGQGRDGVACPGCGQRRTWLLEVRRMGVYVPEPRPQEGCRAKLCFCPEEGGREHLGAGRWGLEACTDCGGGAVHRGCGGLREGAAWHCHPCRSLLREQGSTLEDLKPLWEEREVLLQLHLSGQPGPERRLGRFTTNTSFTDMLGTMLDSGLEEEASPGDSDYESSPQEATARSLKPGGDRPRTGLVPG